MPTSVFRRTYKSARIGSPLIGHSDINRGTLKLLKSRPNSQRNGDQQAGIYQPLSMVGVSNVYRDWRLRRCAKHEQSVLSMTPNCACRSSICSGTSFTAQPHCALLPLHMETAAIAQICSLTGVSQPDAVKLLEKYNYRVDVAADAFFEGEFVSETRPSPSTEKIAALFGRYQDGDEDEIGLDGTINFLNDLQLGLEEPVVLALAYELGSPAVGRWPKSGWIEGMKALQCDTLEDLKGAVERLQEKLGSQHEYFQRVYSFTFGFGLSAGQRSLPVDSATQFWTILLPFSIEHEVLGSQGPVAWNERHTILWIKYLGVREIKGISKDTWGMFLDFAATIDAEFEKYDPEGSWPSLIDDFVGYAKEQLAKA